MGDPHARARQCPGFILSSAALAFLVIAAVVAFHLLPNAGGLAGGALVTAQIAAIVGGAALVGYVGIVVRRGATSRAALWTTATALGWEYLPDVSDRIWGGSIDEQIGRDARQSIAYIACHDEELPFDSAVRVFTAGSGEGATMGMTRAVRIPLPAEAPRLILRSRSGEGALSALPRRPGGRRELVLEGDFSDVFELSVPEGYERDALYVFTPDLMAVLLDLDATLDLEIVDATLHVYLTPPDLADSDELSRFLALIWVLSERFARRTVLYRDEAAPPVDPQAARRSGDTLSARARTVGTRARLSPVVAAVLAPAVPLALGVGWMALNGW